MNSKVIGALLCIIIVIAIISLKSKKEEVVLPPVTPEHVFVGQFEMNVKGYTGAERLCVVIDGVTYPNKEGYEIGTGVTNISIGTDSLVDLSKVKLIDVSPTKDADGSDTNIRVQSIYINKNVNENMRKFLYKDKFTDFNYVSNGLLFFGGEYTFKSESPLDAPVGYTGDPGSIEILARGDSGSEEIRVLVGDVTYPAPYGTLNEDGTVSNGAYKLTAKEGRLFIRLPQVVDFSKVQIHFWNKTVDPDTLLDRNVRVRSIILNGDGVNIRSRLMQLGKDTNYLLYGSLIWGGYYHITPIPPVVANLGRVEINAFGQTGVEGLRVSVDGTSYPALAGNVLDDGTVSTGSYVLSDMGTRIVIDTPKPVDLSKLRLIFTNDSYDPVTKIDREIRIQSIYINGLPSNVVSRLFRSGVTADALASLRNGSMSVGGEYSFV